MPKLSDNPIFFIYIKYENLQKYNDAAVKIQKQYRIYKSSLAASLPTSRNNSFQHPHSIDKSLISYLNETDSNSSNHSDLLLNNQYQKKNTNKLLNFRQTSRFSPSSPLSSLTSLNKKSSPLLTNHKQFVDEKSNLQTASMKTNSTHFENNFNLLQQDHLFYNNIHPDPDFSENMQNSIYSFNTITKYNLFYNSYNIKTFSNF